MYQSYSFSFTEPWLGGKKPNSLTYSFNHFNYSYLGYLRSNPNFSGYRITGMAIGLGRRKKIPDDYFSAYYELSYQYYDLLNATIFPTMSSGFANDISLKYVLSRSSISSPIYPQSGSSFTFTAKSTAPYSLITQKDFTYASEQEKVKFLEYYKLKLTGEWFTPITNDKKLVLRTKFGFAFLGGYSKTKGLTPFERYAMGGSGLSGMGMGSMGREIISLRGYDDLSLSTQGGDPIIAKYTMEMRYPISLNPQATFYVLAFAEAGNTFPTFKAFNPLNVKRSAGVGLRVFLPMFGMLGIDYGWGFDHIDNWGAGYNGASSNSIYNKGYYGHATFTIGMKLS